MSSSSSISSSGFGISVSESTKDAVSEAVKQASVDSPSIAFVSCTVSRDVDEVRKEFASVLPANTLISGITSSASLLTKDGTKSGAVGCLLIQTKNENNNSFVTSYDKSDATVAVTKLKEKMAKEQMGDEPQAILMSSTPGQEEGVIDAINEYFPGIPVFGGTAADDELSGGWKVFNRDEVSDTGVSLVGIGNDIKFGASMIGPYKPTSTKVKVTKADGRRVYEIDGKPAADWAYEWLGDDVKEQYENGGLVLPQTAQKPIGIKKPTVEYVTVTAHLAAFGGGVAEEDKGCIDFFTPIPQDSELVVMDSGSGPSTGYADALSDAFDKAKSAMIADDTDDEVVKAGILIFCGGMAIAVGDNLDDGLKSGLGCKVTNDLPMLGMTCFGEQAYLEKEKENVQRNLSVGMILLG